MYLRDRKWFGLLFSFLISGTTAYGQALDFWTTKDYQYVLRQARDSVALLRSSDPQFAPWLPEGQLGWQFVDARSFHYCFEPDVLYPLAIDFDKTIVLALVRNEPYIWDIQVEGIQLDLETASIHLQYSLNQVGTPLQRAQLSSLVIGIMPHPKMENLGLRNWTFKVEEIRTDVPAEVPYLEAVETIMFPPFFSLQDLREALPLLRNSW